MRRCVDFEQGGNKMTSALNTFGFLFAFIACWAVYITFSGKGGSDLQLILATLNFMVAAVLFGCSAVVTAIENANDRAT